MMDPFRRWPEAHHSWATDEDQLHITDSIQEIVGEEIDLLPAEIRIQRLDPVMIRQTEAQILPPKGNSANSLFYYSNQQRITQYSSAKVLLQRMPEPSCWRNTDTPRIISIRNEVYAAPRHPAGEITTEREENPCTENV